MKSFLAPLGACILIASATGLQADTIRLKNGAELKGKILAETPETVTIEVGDAIKEVRKVPRTDITAVDKQTPDEAVYEKLSELLPTPDLLEINDYKEILEGELGTFDIRYKDSLLLDDVKKISDEIKAELNKVEAGGIKIDGEWITGEQAAADPYNHRGKLETARMRIAAEKGGYLEALRHFDTIDKELHYTTSFKKALDAAKAILPKYDAVLTRMQLENGTLMKTREENLRGMEKDRREKTEKAFEEQMTSFHAGRTADLTAGKTWLGVSKYDAASIEEARATVAAEIERLAALDLTDQKAAANLVASTYASLAADDLEGAAAAIAAAASKGAGGPTVDELREKIDADVAAAEAARVSEAEAAEAARMAEIASKPAVEDAEKVAKKKAEEQAAKERKEAADARKKAKEKKKEEEEAAKAEKKGMPFSTLLIILAAVLAVVTLVAKKFVKPADE